MGTQQNLSTGSGQSKTPNQAPNQAEGKDLAQQAQDAGKQAVQTVKEQASQTTAEVKQQIKEVVSDATTSVQAQAGEAIEGQKRAAADRIGSIAGALREVGQKLDDSDESKLAEVTVGLAGELDQFANRLRDRELGMLLSDAKHLAQRRPELFVTGALAAGFLLGRFLRSSGRSQTGYDDDDNSYDPSQGSSGYAARYGTQHGAQIAQGSRYGVGESATYAANYGGYESSESMRPKTSTANRPSGIGRESESARGTEQRADNGLSWDPEPNRQSDQASGRGSSADSATSTLNSSASGSSTGRGTA